MRCEVRSGGPMLVVMAAVIVLFLVGFFFPSSLHSLRANCMCEASFFFFTLLCNAVSDLGKNMCQRDIGRELSECVTISTSVSSLTAQLTTSLQSSSHKQLEQFSFFSSMRAYTVGSVSLVQDWKGETGELFLF